MLNAAASMLSVSMYIGRADHTLHTSLTVDVIDMLTWLIFAAHFCIAAAGAKSLREHFRSWTTLSSALSLVPILLLVSLPNTVLDDTSAFATRALAALRIFRVSEIAGCMRLITLSEINAQLYVICYISLVLVLVPAALVQLVENERSLWPVSDYAPDEFHLRGLTFFDCTYFMVREEKARGVS